MALKKNEISVVIPAFNEEQAISKVVADLKKLSIVTEIIVIDDGSTDSTRQKAIESGAIVISHERNRGYGASLKTGILNSKNDIIAFIDVDVHLNPEDLLVMNKYIADYDMVIGARTIEAYSLLRWTPDKMLINWLANYLAGYNIPDLTSGLRLIKKKHIIQYFNTFPDKISFTTMITVFFIKDALKVKFTPINVQDRAGNRFRQKHYGINTVILILRLIMLFEPLKIFLPASLCVFAFSIISASYDIINFRMFGATSLFFGITSLLIFFFGLIADQIAAIHKENQYNEK